MRAINALPLALCLLYAPARAARIVNVQSLLQAPLQGLGESHAVVPTATRRLQGRFLHITDIHPDAFYKTHSSTEEEIACHRGRGPAGTYGAETSDCDTPFALVNATFEWIEENLKDTIDFVVWTGDSARHDNDEKIPRNPKDVLGTNKWIVEKFTEVFGSNKHPNKAFEIPIVPTFGNNDIVPHNILRAGPNKMLKEYNDIWSPFIPEEQRHGFERGGWFYVEVIPNKLAVFSLNTMYFFDNNAAVDGCASRSEPGFEHMEWLRVQLKFMRQRGMKALLMGHVPPARTGSKKLWDETCWQKYTLWLQQYRDVVVGGLYGHMNIDHFMLQDTKEIDILVAESQASSNRLERATMDDELSIMSANDYLDELRVSWSDLPNPTAATEGPDGAVDENEDATKKKKKKKSKKERTLKKMGGPWGERYQVTNVGPSIVPNFFPTLRVIEYNITGLEKIAVWADSLENSDHFDWMDLPDGGISTQRDADEDVTNNNDWDLDGDDQEIIDKKKKKGKKDKKHKKKPTDPDLVIPTPPSKGSPPGPAYSPQTLTMLGYTQYFANLTHINNIDYLDFDDVEDGIDADKWHEGKHKNKHPKGNSSHPKPFQYQVEYDTFSDSIFKLKDMTVRSYIKLAHRIGQYKKVKSDQVDSALDDEDLELNDESEDSDDDTGDEAEEQKDKRDGKKKKKHDGKKKRRQEKKNKVWREFVKRAFIGTLGESDLPAFEHRSELGELHDGEL